jgi:dTDP-6-deoxy-L-talose 4-dehydrogenase (NAD+)
MGKRVLVTGAGGYIGRHAVTALCDMGAEVIAAVRSPREIDARAQTVVCNVLDGSADIFEKLGKPDACLHMAWKDGFVHNSDAHMGNLSSHYRFLRDMLDGGLKQLAVMGTMHEVGYWEGAIDENTPCNPISMYGIAKDALRRSTFQMAKGKDVCLQWLRAYYIYGDDKRAVSIFGKIVQAVEEGKTTFPFTTGKNKYDFIRVEELARQIAACVMQTEVDGIINCCTGRPVSLAEQVEGFIREHGFNIRLEYGAFPDRPYDSPGVWGDAEKIRNIMSGIE